MIGYEHQPSLVILSFLFWLIPTLLYTRNIYANYPGKNYLIPLFFFSVFVITGFAIDDTYSYIYLYDSMRRYHEAIHVEPFYFALAEILPNGFYVWRTAIWGGAACFYIITAKLLGLNANMMGLLLPIILYRQFALSRVSLVFALALFFAIEFIQHKNLIFRIAMLGGLLLVVSLHKSAVIYIAIIPLALIFDVDKKKLTLLILLYPFLYGLVRVVIANILALPFLGENTVDSGRLFFENEKSVANINGIIQEIVEYLPLALSSFLLIRRYVFKGVFENKAISFLFSYSILLLYMAMLLANQEIDSALCTRTIHAAYFPILLVLCYYFQNNKRTSLDKVTMYLYSLSALYALSYTYYSWSR